MATEVVDLLGGERVLGKPVKSNLDLARATRAGLPVQTAVQLAEMLGPSGAEDELSAMGPLGSLVEFVAGVLSPSNPANIHVDNAMRRLTPEQSDVVVRIANTLAKAIDVLGAKKKAAHWLTSPNRALGGEVPISLLDTSAGTHEVETILDRIEYGVYS